MFLEVIPSLKFWRKQPNTKLPGTKDDETYDDSAETVRFLIKEPGPCNSYKHCIFTWNKTTSTFYLHQNPNPSSASVEKGKFLLAARKFKYSSHIEYVISLDTDDFSKESHSYVGKLSSDFLGINFTLYENGSLPDGADPSSQSSSCWGFATKQISPVLANNIKTVQICYKFDELKSEGPRSYVCFIKCHLGVDSSENKALRNTTPKWHEDLQCLCFEFKGKVKDLDKDFQSVAAEKKFQKPEKGYKENLLLALKRVGDDTFRLVYRHPHSALQAFANCIAGFGNKFPLD